MEMDHAARTDGTALPLLGGAAARPVRAMPKQETRPTRRCGRTRAGRVVDRDGDPSRPVPMASSPKVTALGQHASFRVALRGFARPGALPGRFSVPPLEGQGLLALSCAKPCLQTRTPGWGARVELRLPSNRTSLRGRRRFVRADSVSNVKFNNALDFVGFCDLSRASPTPFVSQTSLTGFGLTCHAPGVRALWRESLASVRFV
jgi:hypothetical protein